MRVIVEMISQKVINNGYDQEIAQSQTADILVALFTFGRPKVLLQLGGCPTCTWSMHHI